MKIELTKLGKKFGREWIFRNLDLSLQQGDSCAIVGANGSGKSTFLKVASRYLLASEGSVLYKKNDSISKDEDIFRSLGWVAPYTELIEEFTLWEQLVFHQKFKPFSLELIHILDKLALPKAKNKRIKHFSSGMKQKLKLALVFYTNCPILFLDEPTSNLDAKNIDWYRKEMQICTQDRIVLIGSNQGYEYEFCTQKISILDYKP